MKAPALKLLMLALVIALLPHTAHARCPMGIPMSGVVQKVDHASREVVLAQDGGAVRRFVYTTWAKFWHEALDASPSALKPGMKVRVNLHRPLIGPCFVTQITLISNPQP